MTMISLIRGSVKPGAIIPAPTTPDKVPFLIPPSEIAEVKINALNKTGHKVLSIIHSCKTQEQKEACYEWLLGIWERTGEGLFLTRHAKKAMLLGRGEWYEYS